MVLPAEPVFDVTGFFACRLCFFVVGVVEVDLEVEELELDGAAAPLVCAIKAAPVSIKPIIKLFIFFLLFPGVLLTPSRLHHAVWRGFLR